MTCSCTTTASRYDVFDIFCFCVKEKEYNQNYIIYGPKLQKDHNIRISLSFYEMLRCDTFLLFHHSTSFPLIP